MFNKKNTIIMVKKLIYTSGLILSISISMLLSSCSKDELNINQKNLNEGEVTSIDTTPDYEAKGAGEELYYFIINSDDPQAYFDELSVEEKAIVWATKYQLFEESTELNDTQETILYALSSFVYQAQLDQDYDFKQFEEINQNVIAFFNPDQAMDLIYYIDNPSTVTTHGCFWCDEIVEPGPCEIKPLPQGGYYLGRDGFVQKYRFGIRWGEPVPVEIPCTMFDWLDEDPMN